MVPAHDVGVEAEAGHEQKPAVRRPDRRRREPGWPLAIVPASTSRVAPQAEMPRHEIFRARRQDGHRHARPFVQEGRHGAVAADGNQATAPRIAADWLTSADRSSGVQATSAQSPIVATGRTSSSTSRMAVGPFPSCGSPRSRPSLAEIARPTRSPGGRSRSVPPRP